MADSTAVSPAPAEDPAPPRFSLGMRLFLSLLLFDIVFRSLAVLLPCEAWSEELALPTMPTRLPTRAELAALPSDQARRERLLQSADSCWEFFKPWPSAATRDHLQGWSDGGKFVLCWLDSRCEFLENCLGINERWPMFSPNVSTAKTLARTKLLYADGSLQTVRLLSDPEDLTHYTHGFGLEKVLDYEVRVADEFNPALGYCNLLKHRYAHNAAGSPLQSIWIYRVSYRYTPPGEPAEAFLRAQTGPPLSQVSAPFLIYDVTAGEPHWIEGWQDTLYFLGSFPSPGLPVNLALSGDLGKVVLQLDR
jgi:hypothetical protein